MDKFSMWSHVEIECIKLEICIPLPKTQNHSTFKQLITKLEKVQTRKHQHPFTPPSQTHSQTHSLTHSQAIVAHLHEGSHS